METIVRLVEKPTRVSLDARGGKGVIVELTCAATEIRAVDITFVLTPAVQKVLDENDVKYEAMGNA